ncbi:MAG: ABC-F family ATP-binding cassette domain-containing protein [Bacteroidia bacterium]|nr:ABC-F family ATP-binding cassette domain-containing protein [Bacteroidia bacterium]
MNYISVELISKSHGEKLLFENLSFGIAQGQKVALIGVNGSGKSTLLRILAGREKPDRGRISFRNGLRIAYLAQEPDLPEHLTVAESIFSADLPAARLIREYETLVQREPLSDADHRRMEQLMIEIEAADAWNYEVQVRQILGKLEVDFLDRPIRELSGGQRKRVALAQALIESPDLLILDEPTNHLDLDSIEWLESILSSARQSIVLVTHDRYFLDSITNEIYELENGKIYPYKGNYGDYLIQKDEREQQRTAELERNQNLFRTELEWLRTSPRARGTKSKARIDAALTLQEKVRPQRRQMEVELEVKGRRIGGKVLEIKNLRKAYGEKKLMDNFSYTFSRYDRIGIVGPNGAGKTTFLRMITGEEPADSGKIRMGETIVYGYYRQSGFVFKDNQRVIEAVTEAAEVVELSNSQRISAAQLLERFLFPRHMHSQFVHTLSGGERRRLHLLRILMTNPNFLILDEPTNDLDLMTLRRLEAFLQEFEGCLLVVTHDRFFMDRIVDHLFVFEGEGQIRDFPGGYSDYRTRRAEELAAEAALQPAVPKAAPKPAEEKPRSDRPRKISFKEQREFEQLEADLPRMEARKAELLDLLNAGGSDFQRLQALADELRALEADLEAASDRWLELAALMESAS